MSCTESGAPVHALTAKYFPHALVSLRWAAIAFALLTLIFLVPTAWGAAGPTFQGGTGTADDPYLVVDANQLARFRDAVNGGDDFAGKTVRLAADVNLAGGEWTPVVYAAKHSSFARRHKSLQPEVTEKHNGIVVGPERTVEWALPLIAVLL